MRIRIMGIVLALGCVLSLVDECKAQEIYDKAPASSYYKKAAEYVPKFSSSISASRSLSYGGSLFGRSASSILGTSSGPASKPFQYVTQTPTVSPYLNLLREDLSGESAPNYYSLVKPQLNQINFNQQQMRQNQRTSRQIQGIQSRPAFPVGGSQYMIPTGHQSVFMNTLHYYPMPTARRR